MTTAMERTWSLYEAEREIGNVETAEMIGEAYTVMDMIDAGNVDEAFALKTYYGSFKNVTKSLLHGEETNAVKAYRMLEEAMVQAGMLEADDEPEEADEEEANEADHWEDYLLDLKIDQAMENRMLYER